MSELARCRLSPGVNKRSPRRSAHGFTAAPVDEHFPPSVVAPRIEGKDTTRVGPGPKVLATPAQGLADRKGHDRLMDKIQTHPDTAPAICPICGSWPAAAAIRLDGGISIGDYRDDQGHIWTTKWVAA
jgi:hypothetical protein